MNNRPTDTSPLIQLSLTELRIHPRKKKYVRANIFWQQESAQHQTPAGFLPRSPNLYLCCLFPRPRWGFLEMLRRRGPFFGFLDKTPDCHIKILQPRSQKKVWGGKTRDLIGIVMEPTRQMFFLFLLFFFFLEILGKIRKSARIKKKVKKSKVLCKLCKGKWSRKIANKWAKSIMNK